MKWLFAVAGSVAVGYGDLVSGTEVSFGAFYLLPIAYATWFIRARAGLVVALSCAAIWWTIEVAQGTPASSPWVPVWNAMVRLIFFVTSILAVALAKGSVARLLRGVLQRTRRLRAEAHRRRELERKMLETSAREQLRLAQDLHGGLGQYLSALTFHSRMLADDLQEMRSQHAQQAERIVDLIRKTNQLTRQLNRALQVPQGGADGLVAAVRALAAEFQELTGIRCELVLEREPPDLDEFRTVMLFRIVQEAFNNSVKHARPRTIRISVTRSEGEMGLSVVNDGYLAAKEDVETAGLGSLTMKLRAEMIGARLKSGPVATGNYKVECLLPIIGLEPNAGAN